MVPSCSSRVPERVPPERSATTPSPEEEWVEAPAHSENHHGASSKQPLPPLVYPQKRQSPRLALASTPRSRHGHGLHKEMSSFHDSSCRSARVVCKVSMVYILRRENPPRVRR